jgi:hypothetical protein
MSFQTSIISFVLPPWSKADITSLGDMSALPPKADIVQHDGDVRFETIAPHWRRQLAPNIRVNLIGT